VSLAPQLCLYYRTHMAHSCLVRTQAGKPAQRWQMTAENFMAAHGEPPIDEDEIREAVWELLFARAPPALVRVVGKQVYHR
jgi:hypothetical protein